MKRLLALVLSLALLSSFGAALAEEERPTLTIGIAESAKIEDWDTNLMTLALEEELGCNLDFVLFPSKEMGTSLNMMALDHNGRDLPDIIMYAASATQVLNWSESGVIIPLNEYYADPELASNINESFERTGEHWYEQLIMPDGNVYTIPSLNQSYGNEHPRKPFLYKPFLDALNLEIPTTTDELYEVLKAVVNGDPNGNGIKDEIGLTGSKPDTANVTNPTGWFVGLMNSFVYAGDKDLLQVNNGVVSPAYTTEAWKDGLRFIRKLFEEGLIQDAALTQDAATVKTLMNTDDPCVFMTINYTGITQLEGDKLAERRELYIPIMPISGPEGVHFVSFRPAAAANRMFITKNCQYPELAFKLGDLLVSEFWSISTRWGQHGVDWAYISEMEDPTQYIGQYQDAGFDMYIVLLDNDSMWNADHQNRSWHQPSTPYIRQYAIANGQARSKDSAYKQDELDLARYQYDLHEGDFVPEEIIVDYIFTEEENNLITEPRALLLDFVFEYASMVIAGQQDLDSTWDAYLDELNLIGLEDWVGTAQTVYTRMYGSAE